MNADNPRSFGPFRFDLAARSVLRGNEQVSLTPLMYDCLVLLASRPGALVTYAELQTVVWKDAPGLEQSNHKIQETIRKLGDRLGKRNHAGERWIRSVGGYGYLLDVPRETEPPAASPMATSERPLPEAVQARIKELALPHPIAQALIAALSSDRYPTIMSLSSEMVTNPVWSFIDAEERAQLASTFSPWGPLPPRILYADIFLVRGSDGLGRPLLFYYFSGKPITGWQAYLFPFRKRQPGERETERHHRNSQDFGRFLGTDPNAIESQGLGTRFAVSVKRDPGHAELAAYVFEFSAILIKEPPAWLCQHEPVSPVHGAAQRFRWFHPEELEHLDSSMRVNADVLRAVFHFFGTTFTQVPIGLAEPILLAE